MKTYLSKIILALLLMSQSVLADCDFSTGITKTEQGYVYSRDCHVLVGQIKQDLEISNKQKELLNQAIDIKSLASDKADQRADLWKNESFKLEDRLNTMDQMRKTNEYLSFGLGMLTMFTSGYLAAQFYKHQ